jgi:hypothetical protein
MFESRTRVPKVHVWSHSLLAYCAMGNMESLAAWCLVN